MVRYGDGAKPKEVELQYAWNSVAPNKTFFSHKGSRIEVLYPGQWNVECGPDFLNARLIIDGKSINGDIEIHTYPSDWLAHGHNSDPIYKNVILHVVRHRHLPNKKGLPDVPMLVIPEDTIKYLLKTNISSRKYHPGLCSDKLKNKSADFLSDYFSCIGQRRLQNKMLSFIYEIISLGAEAALTKRLFEACGYKNNKDAFLELYQRFSLYDSDLTHFEKEAILWGESGFLSQTTLSEDNKGITQYTNNLWNEWWKLRKKCNENEIKWNLANVRYSNTPWRRLAGMTTFLKQSSFKPLEILLHAFGKSSEGGKDLAAIIKIFTISDPLLDNYLNFNTKLDKKTVLIGKARAIDTVGNIVIPFILAYGKLNHKKHLEQKALNFWYNLPISQSNISLKISAQRWLIKEESINKVFRTFSALQGAIYLYKNFCSFLKMDCSKCPQSCLGDTIKGKS